VLREEIRSYDQLLKEEDGLYPPCYVQHRLRLKPSGLQSARNSGSLRWTKLKGTYYYGKKSVEHYRWNKSRQFKDNGVTRTLAGTILPWPRPKL